MGRSVETHRDAEVIYINASEIEDREDFDWFLENLEESIIRCFPSLEKEDYFLPYPYRESRVILGNRLCGIAVSEYCGLVAVQIIPLSYVGSRYGCEENPVQLQERWAGQAHEKLLKELKGGYEVLNKIGTFSNGNSFFERMEV